MIMLSGRFCLPCLLSVSDELGWWIKGLTGGRWSLNARLTSTFLCLLVAVIVYILCQSAGQAGVQHPSNRVAKVVSLFSNIAPLNVSVSPGLRTTPLSGNETGPTRQQEVKYILFSVCTWSLAFCFVGLRSSSYYLDLLGLGSYYRSLIFD